MNKLSAHFEEVYPERSRRAQCKQKGVVSPVLIIAGVVIIVIVGISIASGAFKFSGYVRNDADQTQNQPQESQKQEESKPQPLNLSETYTHPSPAFSFKYPGDWGLDTKERQVTIFSKDDGADNAKDSPAGMVVSIAPLSGDLAGKKIATLGDLLKSEVEKQFPDGTINESGEVKLGANDSFVYKIVYPNKAEDFQANMYLLTDGSNLYTLFATARKDRFEKYEPTLQDIAESFTLPQQ